MISDEVEAVSYDFERESELYDALCRSTDDYIYMCDMKSGVFLFPQKMVDEFDLPGQIVPNAIPIWGGLIHDDDREEYLADLGCMLSGERDTHNQEYRVRNRSGSWVWVRCRGYLTHDENGAAQLFAGVVTNLGKRSKIDYMSGLLNKHEFESLVLGKLNDNVDNVGILLLGLDNFKHINNLYGWDYGDEVIRQSAQKLLSVLPRNAEIFRLDGDVFGVYSHGAGENELADLYSVASAAFCSQQELGSHRYYATLSGGGVVTSGNDKISFYTLFKRAEYALDYSKKQGKNRLCFYNHGLMKGKDRTLAIIDRLRESANNNFENFGLCYQPQVETDTCRVISAEALLRWQCDLFGSVSPDEFVPLLEQTGLIHAVGRWVLSEAISTCTRWRKYDPNFVISVNLSYLQLLDDTFFDFIEKQLVTLGLDPSGLHVELTESCLASDVQALNESFRRLRGMGISIEMDDFGTGYSSLEVLKNEPADIVKIDRAFVKDITNSDFDATFISFVVALCHSVGILVCLEGVEQWDEYELVKPMKVDRIQGYLFGRPQYAQDFENMFMNHNEVPI